MNPCESVASAVAVRLRCGGGATAARRGAARRGSTRAAPRREGSATALTGGELSVNYMLLRNTLLHVTCI